MIRPGRLGPGSRVSLVAPAGPLPDGAVERGLSRVSSLGWEPIVGRNVTRRTGYLAGSDRERLGDLQEAIVSSDNDAIWCMRGGYGTMRLLDKLDFSPLRERPRPLIGFSDNTALHLAMQREGVVSFHGPHPSPVHLTDFSLDSLRQSVEGAAPAGVLPLPGDTSIECLVRGEAVGPLIGGNLSLLAATVGTRWQLKAAGAILFIEEVGEPMYRIDRLLTQLLMAGVLAEVAGIAVGTINDCPDATTPGLPSPSDVVRDRLAGLGVPLVIGLPFGHVPTTWTLPLGCRARLTADAGMLELLESAVT